MRSEVALFWKAPRELGESTFALPPLTLFEVALFGKTSRGQGDNVDTASLTRRVTQKAEEFEVIAASKRTRRDAQKRREIRG